MKLILILVLFTLNVFGQKSKTENSENRILVSSGQLSKYETIKMNNINFELVLKNKDTIYLATSETRFKTREGYSVGTKFSDLPLMIKQNLRKENGWGYYYTLPSGWSIAFCEGNSCTNEYPSENSLVKRIFKRK
jgi:hypothetical protein